MTDETQGTTDAESQARVVRHPLLGAAGLFIAAAIVCLAIVERTADLRLWMPRSWYANRSIWYLVALAAFVGGCRLLRLPSSGNGGGTLGGRESRFHRLVLYTREGCHLCDQAKRTLEQHSRELPPIEEVDIQTDPKLVARFGTCVPVVEIDGKIRFRGEVNQVLLRRLIDGPKQGD